MDSTGAPTDPYWDGGANSLVTDPHAHAINAAMSADSAGGVFVFYERKPDGADFSGKSVYGQYLVDGSLGHVRSRDLQPRETALQTAYPNPFNPTTVIRFELASQRQVELKVYDVTGRLVRTLVSGVMAAGEHTVRFDGINLASGVYFCHLKAGSFAQTRKMVLLK